MQDKINGIKIAIYEVVSIELIIEPKTPIKTAMASDETISRFSNDKFSSSAKIKLIIFFYLLNYHFVKSKMLKISIARRCENQRRQFIFK